MSSVTVQLELVPHNYRISVQSEFQTSTSNIPRLSRKSVPNNAFQELVFPPCNLKRIASSSIYVKIKVVLLAAFSLSPSIMPSHGVVKFLPEVLRDYTSVKGAHPMFLQVPFELQTLPSLSLLTARRYHCAYYRACEQYVQ